MRKKQNVANKNKCQKTQRLWSTLAHKKQKPKKPKKTIDRNKCKIKKINCVKKKVKEMKTKNSAIEALVKKCKELKHHAMLITEKQRR
jgi:hypothetical protein